MLNELTVRLQAVRDFDGKQVIRRVYRADEVYTGDAMTLAPDLVIGYAKGYRASWATCLGELTPEVLLDNDMAWTRRSLRRCAGGARRLVLQRRISSQRSGVVDMAPSILSVFGLPTPPQMTGKSIFAS